MRRIPVRLKERSYEIIVGRGLIKSAGRMIRRLDIGADAVIVTNPMVRKRFGAALTRSLKAAGITAAFEIIPDSEKAKSADVAIGLIQRISRKDKFKEPFLIALGGGVVGDLTGFAASVYKRGIPYVQVPTTLLSQVDSAIGGKTAIDLPVAKNLVGAFHQPALVLSDTDTLKTLPARQLSSGLAEVIKYGVISDAALFSYLERNIGKILKDDLHCIEFVVERSSRIKARFVELDEFDRKGKRALLNYGHTIGHAIEAACAYSGRCGHGEAVAIGMAASAEIAFWLGMIRIKELGRIRSLIVRAGLPVKIAGAKRLRPDNVYESLLHDKKFRGRMNRFVLPAGIGRAALVEGVPDFVIMAVLNKTLEG